MIFNNLPINYTIKIYFKSNMQDVIKTQQMTRNEILWNVVIFLAVTATALEAPFSITFKTRLQNWQVVLDVIISVIFACDVIYQLREKSKGKLVFNDKSERYFWWGMLFIDIAAAIPYELISYVFAGVNGLRILNYLRLFRLVRIIRLIQIIGKLTVIPHALRISIYVISFVFAVHWTSCAWIQIHPMDGMDNTSEYIMAMYWTVTTLTTIGYGDITPSTNVGRLFTMVVMIAGVMVYGIVIGNISRIMVAGEKYKEKAREKMSDLSSFMKYYNIPPRLQQNVITYYQHILNKRLTDNDNKIINDLPQALQHELQIYMNMRLIRNLPIFKDSSQQCLKDLAAALEQKYYGPGQTVINIGEIGHEMYIIGHGVVEVILKDGNTVATLHEGQFFGEGALVRETKRNANVRAQSYCDLYKLDKESFSRIVARYPELGSNIEKIALKRSGDKRRADDKDSDKSS